MIPLFELGMRVADMYVASYADIFWDRHAIFLPTRDESHAIFLSMRDKPKEFLCRWLGRMCIVYARSQCWSLEPTGRPV